MCQLINSEGFQGSQGCPGASTNRSDSFPNQGDKKLTQLSKDLDICTREKEGTWDVVVDCYCSLRSFNDEGNFKLDERCPSIPRPTNLGFN